MPKTDELGVPVKHVESRSVSSVIRGMQNLNNALRTLPICSNEDKNIGKDEEQVKSSVRK